MTRQFFLYLSQQRAFRRWMERSALAKRLTRRFVAGETLEQGLAVCEQLAKDGFLAALDHLGENVTSLEEAAAATEAYLAALDRIFEKKLPADVAIKLTQFGVDLSFDACMDNVRTLALRAQATGSRVEIDMESSRYTDRTYDIVEKVAAETGCIRCVIQAYLRRSARDVEEASKRRISVRLCKGAYDEPPELAFPSKKDVDENYVALMKRLFDVGTFPAIATHDPAIIQEALHYIRAHGIAADRFEFQMLYGVRRDLQRMLVRQGYRLRVYVPYGTAWYPYFMRRLAERPANVWFLARSLLR